MVEFDKNFYVFKDTYKIAARFHTDTKDLWLSLRIWEMLLLHTSRFNLYYFKRTIPSILNSKIDFHKDNIEFITRYTKEMEDAAVG